MSGLQPEILTPEEWRQYLLNARQALRANPQDQEALQAIRDAVSALNALEQAQVPQTGDRSVLGAIGGVARGLWDIPEAIGSTALAVGNPLLLARDPEALQHTKDVVGQITGAGNWPEAAQTFSDDESGLAERLAAVVRSTPANIGYAPQRALMETMADPTTSSFDRARRLTNVASLGLVGGRAGSRARPAPTLGAPDLLPVGDMSLTSRQVPRASAPRAPLTPVEPPAAMPPVLNQLEVLPVGDMSLIPRARGSAQPAAAPTGTTNVVKRTITGDIEPPVTGIDVEGASAMPQGPFPPTILEMQTGRALPSLSQARQRYAGHTAESILPEVVENLPREGAGSQKTVQFGTGSPLSPAAKAEVKALLGEMSGTPRSVTRLGGEEGFLGFSVGPFLSWEIMRRTIRPMLDKTLAGFNPQAALNAINNSPRLQALERVMIQAYFLGQAEKAQQSAEELATELLMQVPQE